MGSVWRACLIALSSLTYMLGCVVWKTAAVPMGNLSLVMEPYAGPWIQIYSNYYVQSTTEIDWKCVHMTLTFLPIGHAPSSKTTSRLRPQPPSSWPRANTTITTVDTLQLQMTKSALLHGIPKEQVHVTTVWGMDLSKGTADTDTFHLSHWFPPANATAAYEIRDEGPMVEGLVEYLLVTHSKTMAMFVFARDYDRFFHHYNHHVVMLMAQLQYKGYYKAPLLSYTSVCEGYDDDASSNDTRRQ